MNKGLIAIIAVIVVALGAYGGYYAYAVTYLVPQDINVLKEEISLINETGSYDDDIADLERQANNIENASSLKLIPLEQRQKQANDLENGQGIQTINSTLNKIEQHITTTKKMASGYDLLLKGDVAKGLKSAYSEEILNTLDGMGPLMAKLGQDLVEGDNKAVASDLRELANALRTFDEQEQISASNLQDVVNRLEAKKQWIFF